MTRADVVLCYKVVDSLYRLHVHVHVDLRYQYENAHDIQQIEANFRLKGTRSTHFQLVKECMNCDKSVNLPNQQK